MTSNYTRDDMLAMANNVLTIYGHMYIAIPSQPWQQGFVVVIDPEYPDHANHIMFNDFDLNERVMEYSEGIEIVKGTIDGFFRDVELGRRAE